MCLRSFDHGRFRAAQKWVGCLFLAQCRGNGRTSGGAQRSNPLDPRADQRILGFDGQGEAQIGFGIFVRAVDQGVVRQRSQAVRASAASAPACPRTDGRSRRRTACRRRRPRPERNRQDGRAYGRRPAAHRRLCPSTSIVSPPLRGVGAACDRLSSRSEDPGLPARDKFFDTTLMVVMMVGDQDGLELQMQRLEPGDYRRGVARIDHGSSSVTDQQPDVVVLERGNGQDFEHAGTIERRPPDVNSGS